MAMNSIKMFNSEIKTEHMQMSAQELKNSLLLKQGG